ncbi:glycosyl hydrolase [Myxococcus sp. K38C18041901]|uniref:alpha-amylase family glycosyl hydrolase n=1 Tax=Myxococcus guangdongensis TaxID=2906760 RepID=UPI0020A76A56|nr:alpha-amylase family glycosyl hydrolase [Myxococcus guangdongensis]MCP3057814.1 glycosyl hydrolase [Myxococcus guangdongensis]
MVLRQRWLWSLVLALVASGCLKRQGPPVLAPEGTVVAVAYIRDDARRGAVSNVPEGVRQRVAEVLAKRNLQAREVPYDEYAAEFAKVTDTQRRFAMLKARAGDAPLLLLVETRVTFFGQVGGRFSWDVYVKTTANRATSSLEATSDSSDYGAALQFDQQREDDAQLEVARQISGQAGALFDSFLASPMLVPSTDGGPGLVPGLSAPAGEGIEPGTSTPTEPPPPPAKSAPQPYRGQWTPPEGDAIYFVMVDRFANGDAKNDGAVDAKDAQAFHGGDLRGVIDRLDGLQALGVRTVWLSPVFQMRTDKFYGYGAFHGYWVEDFGRVEPRFGDEALLKELSSELRRRDMRLVLDVVLNHVGPETRLTREQPKWFHGLGPIENWNDSRELVMRDVHGLPDLAVEREEVYQHLLSHSLKWVDTVKPAGFRLDAVKHLPMDFWARYNDDLRAHAGKDFLLLGELLDGDPVLLARVMKEGRFGTMFDFPLAFALVDVFCRGRSPSHLGAILFNDRFQPAPQSLVTLLDNHDLPRVMSECGGDVEKVKRALAVQLTARGVPALTYGIEEGLTGAKEPENRGDMRFTQEHPLRAWIARLLEARRGSEALQRGETMVLAAREDFFAYVRVTPDDAFFVGINSGTERRIAFLPTGLGDGSGIDPLTGTRSMLGRLAESAYWHVDVKPGEVSLVRLRAASPGGHAALVEKARTEWKGEGPRRTVVLQTGDAAVRVVGGGPELGGWKPERSLRPDAGAVTLSLPEGGVFEYKLVREDGPGKFSWEGGPNRLLFVPELKTEEGPVQVPVAWEQRSVKGPPFLRLCPPLLAMSTSKLCTD